MLHKYNEYITESLILESLLLESEVIYSDQFKSILKKVDDKISNILLDIEKKDIETSANYLDIDKEKNDTITFTPDRRVKEILADKTENVRFTGRGGGWLNHVPANKGIFGRLGYTVEEGTEVYKPNSTEVGKVVAKVQSNTSSRIYVYVKFPGGEGVYNAEKLNTLTNFINIWDKYRQEIRIGRIARALLISSNSEFVDRDIELFVNSYKAAVDKFNDKFSYFEEVKGGDIIEWYEYRRYVRGGTLGSSCMSSGGSKLKLYAESENVSLVIYKSPEDETKILGRAILWTLLSGKKFMDRVYTARDSDYNLFNEYAKEEGYYYKDEHEYSDEVELVAQAKPGLERFPYLDTLTWYNYTTGLISNKRRFIGKGILLSLQCTDGGVDEGMCTDCDGSNTDCGICGGKANDMIERFYDQ